jgi:two-component system, OmpR family, KDP operon response regulator KdpE
LTTSPNPGTILAIDDEPSLLRLLRLELSTHGYCVVTAANGEEGLERFASHRPDVVLLDIILPGLSGLDVLRKIKSESNTPVVLITARSTEQTRLEALALGADDFIAKPFSPERVTDSIRYLLAGARGEAVRTIVSAGGGIKVDLHRRLVMRGDEPIHLSRSEWQLIEELARSPGEPLLYQELLSNVWGPEYRNDVAYLRMWMQRLKSKLGDSSERSEVIRPYLDVGFILNASLEPEE